MLFDLRETPIPTETAPFIFDHADQCRHTWSRAPHLLPDRLRADLAESRGGKWWWHAEHRYDGGHPDPGGDEANEREVSEAGSADTKAEALAACVAWMRSRLPKAPTGEVKS